MTDREKRAEQTFVLRPLPTASDKVKALAAGNPAAAWGPYPEGTFLVISSTHPFRALATNDQPQAEGGANPLPANAATVPQLHAGVHDFSMTRGCQYVICSPVTQPPPAGCEISVWPADAPASVCT